MDTDAREAGNAAVLSQLGINGLMHFIVFARRRLRKPERN